ncbi:hypothetical protein Tco_1390728, partial [Tanacetum coccineum]
MTNTQTPPTVVNTTGAPVTNAVANHAEKPEKFNGLRLRIEEEMSVEDLVVRLRIEEDNKLAQKDTYTLFKPGHIAANCKMPKRVNPRQANMVDKNVDMIEMVSNVCAMISEVKLIGTNNSDW